MIRILHDPPDPKLWELWSIPFYGNCRIYIMSRMREENATLLVSYVVFGRPLKGDPS